MKSFSDIPYERPLIIGTKGGNDMVSSTLVLSDFFYSGKNPALAGLCSPGAWHSYDGKDEKPVNLVTENTRRFRPSKNPVDISYIDARIPALLKQHGISTKVFNLSCRYGTSALVNGLNSLIEQEDYDGIIAVDVGGDILARGKQDPTILSPLMDFTTLHVVSRLNIPSTLVEFGLQTDGELRPRGCEEILRELEQSGLLKNTFQINRSGRPVETFTRIYRGIEKIRHGHTAEMTLKTLEENRDLNETYTAKVRVLDKKWSHSFPVTLEKKYFGKVFVIDLNGLEKTRDLAFPYETPLELYLKTKMSVNTKTEMDMLYARVNETTVWLGLLWPEIKGNLRKQILDYGLKQLTAHADVALLWEKDHDSKSRDYKSVGEFILTGENKDKIEEVAKEVEKLI